MAPKRLLRTGFAVGAMLLVGLGGASCGEEAERASTTAAEATTAKEEDVSEYEEVLSQFRVAASAGETYDAYGIAEYFPSTQRAAVDAFCFIADQLQKNPAAKKLGDPVLTERITRKAEADLQRERDIVAPRPTRRAIGKLHLVLELESLDPDQAKDYARACYH